MTRSNAERLLLTAAVVITTLAGIVSGAQAGNGDWEFDVSIYGWLPTIEGRLTHDVPGVGNAVEIDPGTLLDNLSFTAMGALAARRGKWSFGADLIYLKETKAESQTIAALGGLQLDADYTLNSWIVNLAAGYRIAQTPTVVLRGLLGARYFSAESTLSLRSDGPPPIDQTLGSAPAIWNGFLGANGRVELGKSWILPFHLDVGTGDSDLTWQGYAGVGYAFKWGGPVLGYRYLSFDQGEEGSLRSLSFGGPELGVGFRF